MTTVPTTHTPAGVDEFDAWIDRARAGDADAVIAEVEAALQGRVDEPRWAARAFHTQAVGHASAGRGAEAAEAAGRCLEQSQSAKSDPLTALALSVMAGLTRDSGDLRRGLDLHQQAERLLARAGDEVFEDARWTGALVDMWVTASRLGLRLRSLELGQFCRRLSNDLTTPYERYLIARNTAEAALREALRPARRPPYEADDGLLSRARSLADDAAASTPEHVSQRLPVELWQAMVDAWSGEAERALPVLDHVLERGADQGNQTRLQSLEPALRASRLRALLRLDRVEDARAVCATERDVAEQMDGDTDALAGYLWERVRCTTPECIDPDSDVGRLAALWESREVGWDEVMRGVLDLHLSQDEMQIRQRVLDGLTRHDELTGVLNRRGLAPLIEAAALDATGQQWALLLADIDGFKQVNDTLGHVLADDLLQIVAQGLQTASRADDVVARLGGDEFVLLAAVPDHDADLLAGIGERVRSTVAELDPGGHLRLSIGVADRSRPVEPSAWLHQADQAMYAAKRAGGDRVVVAGTPGDS